MKKVIFERARLGFHYNSFQNSKSMSLEIDLVKKVKCHMGDGGRKIVSLII